MEVLKSDDFNQNYLIFKGNQIFYNKKANEREKSKRGGRTAVNLIEDGDPLVALLGRGGSDALSQLVLRLVDMEPVQSLTVFIFRRIAGGGEPEEVDGLLLVALLVEKGVVLGDRPELSALDFLRRTALKGIYYMIFNRI